MIKKQKEAVILREQRKKIRQKHLKKAKTKRAGTRTNAQ